MRFKKLTLYSTSSYKGKDDVESCDRSRPEGKRYAEEGEDDRKCHTEIRRLLEIAKDVFQKLNEVLRDKKIL